MTISRILAGILVGAVASAGCNADDKCGAGTVEVDGACVPDGTGGGDGGGNECGTGTVEQGGECVPDGTVICATGTTYDADTGTCVPDITGCAAGTVLVEGECVPEDQVRQADVEESMEPNDADLDSDGFETFDLPAVGEDIVLHGCVDPYRDVEKDGEVDPDFDAFVFQAAGPTLLDITIDGVGGAAGGFRVTAADPVLDAGGWIRFGINLTGDTTQQQVFLPAAGIYVLLAGDSRSLVTGLDVTGLAAGGPDACYYATVVNATRPAPTPIAKVGEGTLGGDVQFWSYDPAADGAVILTSLEYSSASSAAAVVEMVNDEYRDSSPFIDLGVEVLDNFLTGLSAADEVVLVVEPIVNFSLRPVDTSLTLVTVPTAPLPTDGTPLSLTQDPTNPTFPSNLVWIRGTAGDVVRYQFDPGATRYFISLFPPSVGDFFLDEPIATVCDQCAGVDAWAQLQETGYYYFLVSNDEVANGTPFDIAFDITSDTPTVLDPLAANPGTLAAGDRDFFEGTVAGLIWLEFTVAPTNFTSARVTFYDRNAAGQLDQIVLPTDQGVSSNGLPFGRIVDGLNGTFLISVENADGHTGTETFDFSVGLKDFTDAGDVDDPPVNDIAIAAAEPTFVFLRATPGESVRVSVSDDSGAADLIIEPVDRRENVLFSRDNGGAGAEENYALVVGQDGFLAMRVRAAADGTFDLDATVADLGTAAGASEPDLAIPDGDPIGVTDTVAIADPCAMALITVDVDISHTFRGDLQLALTSPSGTSVLLKAPALDPGDDLVGTYPTTLEPVESLAAFLGEDAAGDWTLSVIDTEDEDTGTLNAWGVSALCM